ncbi:MAG: tyrosine--tRNA ligase [Candidatus Melainabacteria bacterium]|nr:tyrosine--tRNA ligase [Candidatus Melainabacteria bacterium]
MSDVAATAAAAEVIAIETVFLEQAKALCMGGELLPGGVEALARRLQQAAEKQQPLRVKLGLDPTRPDLHLGHTVVLRKLRMFQDLGHQAVLIIGDATAMIGDPSGRNVTRPPLTEEEVLANAQTYLDQAAKVLDVRKAEIVRNSQWLSPMTLNDFLRLAAKVTVAQIMVRDDFQKRYAENRPIALHEIFYPLMQGYDSVMVRADIELGGTDQRFNNLMGRELQQAYATASDPQPMEPQMVLLMPLLEGTDGKTKMSKSYPEHCINLTDSPSEMYGKLMSIPDAMIIRYEALLTPVTAEQVAQHQRAMQLPAAQGGINPRDLKAMLAKWMVGQYHSQEAATEAETQFVQQFRNKEIPQEIPETTLNANMPHKLIDVMADYELAPSKTEARRLIQGGGVKLDGQNKVTDPEAVLNGAEGQSVVLQVGKRKFLRLYFR